MRLGIIMDPPGSIHYKKDSTLAMLWEAQRRQYEIFYFDYYELALNNDVAYGQAAKMQVFQDPNCWYQLSSSQTMRLDACDLILMRKDPPFNEQYLYVTYVLEAAEKSGALVVNKAQSLRDANEKIYATHFSQFIPPSLVTASVSQLKAFWQQHQDIVCKPLHAMGGKGIFRLRANDANAAAAFALLTQDGTVMIMAQKFVPEISAGDKRILLINGEPISHALVRIPASNDWRGNLAQGATAKVQPLTDQDKIICAALADDLKRRGLYFVGIDVIGNYLTEINITSPTGIRELEATLNINISDMLFSTLETLL